MGKKSKHYKFKINTIPIAKYHQGTEIVLDLPPVIDNLPMVSVVTITKNRVDQFELVINNWKSFLYPEHLIEWIVIDDSEVNTLGTKLQNLHDSRIKYYYEKEFPDIGIKRNYSIEKSRGEIIVHMDDDDFHYADSVLAKVRCLQKYKKYKKKCLFSSPIGVYNLKNNNSQVLEGDPKVPGVPEATMAYYRSFWESSSKFKSECSGEGLNMIWNQDKHLLKIPYFFNCICFTQPKNTTTSTRDLIIAGNEHCMNFMDLFPPEVVVIVKNWRKSIGLN